LRSQHIPHTISFYGTQCNLLIIIHYAEQVKQKAYSSTAFHVFQHVFSWQINSAAAAAAAATKDITEHQMKREMSWNNRSQQMPHMQLVFGIS